MLIKSVFLIMTLVLSLPVFAVDSQVSGYLELINTYNVKMAEAVNKAGLLRESIGSNIDAGQSINCASQNVAGNFQGRCEELIKAINNFNELDKNSDKLKSLVSGIDSSITFTKLALDRTAITGMTVTKSSKDIYEMDKTTPDCKDENLKGWKCLDTPITTIDGNTYHIRLKWNRINIPSRGTVFYGIGGAGMGDSRQDPPSKAIMDQVDTMDNMRTLSLEMMDPDVNNIFMSGGYWAHAGGYKRLAQIFNAVMELVIEKNLMHGSFANYFGGSNGSMLAASGFSLYNLDVYFARAIFQMGPFLPNLQTACDKNSASSLYLNKGEQFNFINSLLGTWTFHDPAKTICDNMAVDNISILKDGKNIFPNTRIHVIMGAKEVTEGFGPWMLASNLEWYKGIQAKSKERIVRSYMAHNNSYEDFRRYMKLGPDEVAENSNLDCHKGSFDSNGTKVDYSCGCGLVEGGVIQPDGCFHKLAAAPAIAKTSNVASSGSFCNPEGNETKWICGVSNPPGSGWINFNNGCFHMGTKNKCK